MSNGADWSKCRFCGADLIVREDVREKISAYLLEGRHVPRFACPDCIRADWIRRAKQRAAMDPASAERARWSNPQAAMDDPTGALAWVGVPPAWQLARLDNCPDLSAGIMEALRKYASSPRGFLVLSGRPGCGKTWGCVAILAELLRTGRRRTGSVRFLSEGDYLRTLREGFASDPVNDRLLPSTHPRACKMLALDDLASTYLTPWGRGEVAGLIEKRYRDELPTILTTNLSLAELAGAVDARLTSRLAEDGQVFSFPAVDLRLTGKLRPPAEPAGLAT